MGETPRRLCTAGAESQLRPRKRRFSRRLRSLMLGMKHTSLSITGIIAPVLNTTARLTRSPSLDNNNKLLLFTYSPRGCLPHGLVSHRECNKFTQELAGRSVIASLVNLLLGETAHHRTTDTRRPSDDRSTSMTLRTRILARTNTHKLNLHTNWTCET